MHPNNIHNAPYNFQKLISNHQQLLDFVINNKFGIETIEFSNSEAVLHLNKALLKTYYSVNEWNIPEGYLCPPIPGRLDYLLYIKDLIVDKKTNIKGLDIGVGANCIYPILASQLLNWDMVGADIDVTAVASANENSSEFKEKIEIRHQENNSDIFKGIINEDEYFDFTICNPPFHASEKEATKGTLRKLKNLKNDTAFKLNFGGQANELWCNGGEALFIKRMIRESVAFKTQVGWFTTLVSKNDNLKAIYKQLSKLNAEYTTVDMEQGNKKSRFVAWKFPS
ncbi:23S rRNA (adenine(1618)-N(6))-methyltransferase RlmF [Cellulophaga sp. HaHaR_3_176]|uniref:23S rRNA (adenine(1618)-N(6))-methyltransferase RlmF n=1 Tax=Cellulophaga sp. HaHaR_3_176 TaxID=1942464 RepID=UPI001C1F3659|nr:23S rRNA (adenine(1618)-N(6))-methyltransferase RlmF [Cellulophaga sp. HaHaR_3_176]QWX85288.1 23S rRNA (adenine(1618)-N(6))-methyltransferase RlmF [Cellulophaga sp. HaHaR_3_176]